MRIQLLVWKRDHRLTAATTAITNPMTVTLLLPPLPPPPLLQYNYYYYYLLVTTRVLQLLFKRLRLCTIRRHFGSSDFRSNACASPPFLFASGMPFSFIPQPDGGQRLVLDEEARDMLKTFIAGLPEGARQEMSRYHTVESLQEKMRLAIKGERTMDTNELAAAYFLGVKPEEPGDVHMNVYIAEGVCFTCGKSKADIAPTKMKTCGACMRVNYCSPACQRWHWDREHKTSCKRKRTASGSTE